MTATMSRLVRVALGIAFVVVPAAAQSQMLLGIHYGGQGLKMEQVQALEAWQGKKYAVVDVMTDWTNAVKTMNPLFGQQLPNVWNNGNVPMITWEPYTGGETPNDIELRIAAGQYDSYINNWAGRLKAFLSGPDGVFGNGDDRRVFLRLAHAMNGNWYPWSAAMGFNSPLDHMNMWIRVHGIFAKLGLDAAHLQWVWSVNAEDVGGSAAEEFYPGNEYVDWISVDGYNWGAKRNAAPRNGSEWRSPAQVFDTMIARVRKISGDTKPLALTEIGTSSAAATGTSVAMKSAWITDLFAYAASKQIKMLCWFNNERETDWAVFGGANGDGTYKSGKTTYKTYGSYKTAVQSGAFANPNTATPGLISPNLFAGK